MSTTNTGNRILDALPSPEASRILPQLKQTELKVSELIYDVDRPLVHVYFPTSAVISMMAFSEQGSPVEIGTIGREGFSGVQIVLGTDRSPTRAICQIPGSAQCTTAETVVELMKSNRTFEQLMKRFTQGVIVFMGQSIACNRFHTIVERCARWLLLTSDRVGSDTFQLTQEFLAMMLGVHRPGVSVAAGALQEAGFVTYRRGNVTIKDRKGLEGASCECYRIVTDEFERLYHLSSGGGASPGTRAAI